MKKGIFCLEPIIFYFDFISAREAMKIIRKRLQIYPATLNWRSIGFTLTVLFNLNKKNCFTFLFCL